MNFSTIETEYLARSGYTSQTGRIPYIIVDNFPELGLLTARRFLEWVDENPNGVISLPTGKTPEYFINWTQKLVAKAGTDLSGLTFIQMDDFYPINPHQHNSFYHYVKKFYIKGLGLNIGKALLINSDEIPIKGKYSDIFPDLTIDLSLRQREPVNHLEKLQQDSIFMIDSWCMEREQRIRDLGGIGFFLGGIGPDGHIAFNIKGSDHHSTTRLSATNYATQAAAAGDLGGIEVSANRHVITIGLGTITMNPEAVTILFAAGESKAAIVRSAIEEKPDVQYPASVLQKLPNARFYLTEGAAKQLTDVRNHFKSSGEPAMEKSIRWLLDYCQVNNVYGHKIEHPPVEVLKQVEARLLRGLKRTENKVILHTGPHHDDIMLGLMPLVNRQLRSSGNQVHFAIATSGFTALSNRYLIERLEYTMQLIEQGEIQMLKYPDFFTSGYLYKWDKDVSHYLNKVGERDEEGKFRGLSHRIVRCLVKIHQLSDKQELKRTIEEAILLLQFSYDGEKNPQDIQQLKGMIREFEEELVWAHSGIQVKDVHHLRLGFYKGDIFTEQPEEERDVQPILDLLNKIKPDIISVTMDPEGSGPDTHYKVLQATAKALQRYAVGTHNCVQGDGETGDRKEIRVIGYRNVWYRYHPAEANVYVPVSLNSMAVLQNSFRQCYLSQVNASFPSPELNGPFCDLAQKVWVDQFKEIQLLLGKDYFYENDQPLIRATHGLIFYKDMSLEEFLGEASELARRTE